MKAKNLIVAYFSTLMAASSATVVGINFHGSPPMGGSGDPATAQQGGNTFGATWTDLVGTVGSAVSLNGTPATLDYQAGLSYPNNLYQAAGSVTGSGAPNSGLSVFRNYLNDNGTTLTLNGLNSWLAAEGATGYTVTLYLNSNQGSGFHTPTVAGVSLTVPILGNGRWDGSAEDPNGDSAVGIRGQASTGVLTGDSVTIFLPQWNANGAGEAERGGLAALVITAVPEPATASLSALGMLMLLRRRRQR